MDEELDDVVDWRYFEVDESEVACRASNDLIELQKVS